MEERKRIKLWLDLDLVPIFKKLNHKMNKPFFEHQLRSCFFIYYVNHMEPYQPFNIILESFGDSEKITRAISRIILRMKFTNRQIQNLPETLDFMEPYL